MGKDAKPPECRKVLLVDDEQDILYAYGAALRHAGFEVQTAESGNKALGLMKQGLPQVLILDLMMGDGSGFEVLLKLQQLEGPKPAVIVVTGVYTDEETSRRIRGEPVVFELLIKPVRPKMLVETVRRAMGIAL
ncbi:MAG: response regulator [Elusimicrobiota bacterium]